ncbi:MAG: hypothetical protein IH595_00840 [Bacteroidales bacterium]|nr:hypothetical protein [Bacteroidales bacterium]
MCDKIFDSENRFGYETLQNSSLGYGNIVLGVYVDYLDKVFDRWLPGESVQTLPFGNWTWILCRHRILTVCL